MFWYVSSKQSTDTRDGRSLDTAFRRILHAIHVAEPEDTIVIVPGVYDQDLAKQRRRGSLGTCECDSRRERDADIDRLCRSVAGASRHDGLSHADLSISLREMRKKVRAHRDHLRACRGETAMPASATAPSGVS
jgi:hypothetical protein